jgi:hypothetical protein
MRLPFRGAELGRRTSVISARRLISILRDARLIECSRPFDCSALEVGVRCLTELAAELDERDQRTNSIATQVGG